MSDAEIVFDRVVARLAAEGQHDFAMAQFRWGPGWILMAGPHDDDGDGLCWCQPRVEYVTCANASHWHMPDCDHEDAGPCIHSILIHQDVRH